VIQLPFWAALCWRRLTACSTKNSSSVTVWEDSMMAACVSDVQLSLLLVHPEILQFADSLCTWPQHLCNDIMMSTFVVCGLPVVIAAVCTWVVLLYVASTSSRFLFSQLTGFLATFQLQLQLEKTHAMRSPSLVCVQFPCCQNRWKCWWVSMTEGRI